jgi:predicted O-linked N-acetylglucosamine transferase (SPINDLY family)
VQERKMTAIGNEQATVDVQATWNAQKLIKSWSVIELFTNADMHNDKRDPEWSAALYKCWISYHEGDPLLYTAYFNYAVFLTESGDRTGAVNALRECIRLNPDFVDSYVNLGRLLEDRGQIETAVSTWFTLTDRLKAVNGESVKKKILILEQIGRVLEQQEKTALAEEALKQSLEISIGQPKVIEHYVSMRQRQCKWPAIEGSDRIPSKSLLACIAPLSLANLLDDPMFQLARAFKYNKSVVGLPQTPSRRWRPIDTGPRNKLRIGYVSSDLREHAVGFAMTDVFEQHDRQTFEIHAYYCGIDRQDPTQNRIKSSADKWTDINGVTDELAAKRITEDKIDILVDLNGYTKDARTRLWAFRPAPIAVNWFGFPGTMGTPYHHYIIADNQIIPNNYECFYSEKVLHLPCYQPNDRKRPVASPPVREEENLPDNTVVYCSLNGTQKIIPEVFASWMAILSAVPNSVLWLLESTADISSHLRSLAQQNGVSPDRLIFAKKKINPQHLARYALADLFLDTFPYGAHTTAADALWMGVPVLTAPGHSFASRVCSSLIRAAGIGDLVCSDLGAYEAKAIELGRNPQALAGLKQKLTTERSSCLLFNTPLLVEKLEDLYRGMWEDYSSGCLPKPDLNNMDAYHDIGVRLHVDDISLSGSDLRSLYRRELEAWHETWPLTADSRLWQVDR